VSIDIGDVKVIKIVKKSKALLGAGAGRKGREKIRMDEFEQDLQPLSCEGFWRDEERALHSNYSL